MIKTIISAVVVVSLFIAKDATAQQATNNASQSVTLQLQPVIQISTVSNPDVKLGFNTVSHYASGVESGKQQFKVHSNKDYVVSVKTNATSFSYSGNAYPTPSMPVNDILYLAVADNNTGGEIANSFQNFISLSNIPQILLSNCRYGGNKTFSVNYKATPGTQYPAGDYTVGVIYTATQP